MVIGEGVLGSTVVSVKARDVQGDVRVATEGRLVEGLYTNRAFIAGVGSVPSTNPTSLAGASSLVLGPPLWYRNAEGRVVFEVSGLFSFGEAIVKGLIARGLHALGVGAGGLASGGRFTFAQPEHQITLTEGESVEISFFGPHRKPRAVPTQVSGDPTQARQLEVRVAWGPLPLLAAPDSLLFAAAQRALTRLRQLQAWNLQTVYIGGQAFFRQRVGVGQPAVPPPPRTLPRRLDRARDALATWLQSQGLGPLIDTSEQGLGVSGRARHAHTSDHKAHLVVVRERGVLLVRVIRRQPGHVVVEQRTTYRAAWGRVVIHDYEVRRWTGDAPPVLLEEEHYFRDAATFRMEAPRFFSAHALAQADERDETKERTGPSMTRRTMMSALVAGWLVACGSLGSNGTPVPEHVAKVGCGLCRFQIPGSTSCYWAIELEGQHYPVVGANQPDHESHGPDGMCVMDRQARVAGRIKRGQFIASTFELIPAEGVDMNAEPPTHQH